MQVKIQRKGHAVETLTDPTFEQCFNPAGQMQCAFLGIEPGHPISIPVTAKPVEASRTVHHVDGDKAKVEYGFADRGGEFGQLLPHVWSRGDGGPTALYKNATTAGVSCATTQ